MSRSNMRAPRTDSPLTPLFWLALAVLVAHGNSLTGAFQFDDYNVIVHEPRVHTWSAWVADLGHGIRPLLKLSYLLDWLTGTGTVAFHLTNLLIHLANSWLVYLLTQRLMQHWLPSASAALPLWVALLFAVHPAHSEAVVYISGRSTALMTLFYLTGVLAYIDGRMRRDAVRMHVLTPLLFLLALGSKETAVTLPLALWLWEWSRGTRWREALKAGAASWLVWLSATLIFLSSDHYLSMMARSAHFNTLGGNLATQANGLLWLLRQWSLPLWLNIDPDLPLYRHLADAPWALLGVLTLAGAAWWLRQRSPWWTFALVWALLQLLPLYVLLPRLDIANERQLYLVGWPLTLALCIELFRHVQAGQARIAMVALLLAAGLLTAQRNLDYRSEIALWQDTVQKSPHKARTHNNLGYAYLLANRHEEARKEFLTALDLDLNLHQARHNLYRTDDEMRKIRATRLP